jgi:hypothetical protein
MLRDVLAAEEDMDMDISAKPAHDDALRDLIAVRAYELWENQGRPRGCDLLHWYQAEQEIIACVAARSGEVAVTGTVSAGAAPAGTGGIEAVEVPPAKAKRDAKPAPAVKPAPVVKAAPAVKAGPVAEAKTPPKATTPATGARRKK